MTKLHSRKLGDPQGRAALLAHCFLGHSGGWGRLIEALPTPLDALAFDMPGHGRSPMPDAPGDFHAMVAAAVGAFVQGPSLMIGHSFGAASMLRHALDRPETVTGLVLIEPVVFCAAFGQPEYGPYRQQEQALHDAVITGNLPEAARQFLALNPGSPVFDALPPPVQAVMAAQMRLVAATVDGLFHDSGRMMAPGRLEGFSAPVLIVLGSDTTPIFQAVARGLVARLPRAEVAVIAGAGHMAPISHPEGTGAAIHGWMQRNGLT